MYLKGISSSNSKSESAESIESTPRIFESSKFSDYELQMQIGRTVNLVNYNLLPACVAFL